MSHLTLSSCVLALGLVVSAAASQAASLTDQSGLTVLVGRGGGGGHGFGVTAVSRAAVAASWMTSIAAVVIGAARLAARVTATTIAAPTRSATGRGELAISSKADHALS